MTRSVSAEACLPLIMPLPAASTNQRERTMTKVFPKLMRTTSQPASEAAFKRRVLALLSEERICGVLLTENSVPSMATM